MNPTSFPNRYLLNQVEMYSKLFVVLLVYLSVADCNDIQQGYTNGRSKKIFSELLEASPALWKRTYDVVVNTTNMDVINAIYVTDLREDRDGEAVITSGGVGMRSVVISLKSPSILRGYKFQVDVFASDPYAVNLYKGGGYFGETQYPRKF